MDEQKYKNKSAKGGGTNLNSSDGFKLNVSISDDLSALRQQSSSMMRNKKSVPKVQVEQMEERSPGAASKRKPTLIVQAMDADMTSSQEKTFSLRKS